MELEPFVAALRTELAAAAAVGTDETRRAAELLAAAMDPAARLVLLDVLTAAAAELTAALPSGTVELRLVGRQPELVMTATEPPAAAPPPPDGEEGTARVSLRLPETLKVRMEDAAAREGLSANSWLVRAVAHALDDRHASAGPHHRAGRPVGSRLSGWARG